MLQKMECKMLLTGESSSVTVRAASSSSFSERNCFDGRKSQVLNDGESASYQSAKQPLPLLLACPAKSQKLTCSELGALIVISIFPSRGCEEAGRCSSCNLPFQKLFIRLGFSSQVG